MKQTESAESKWKKKLKQTNIVLSNRQNAILYCKMYRRIDIILTHSYTHVLHIKYTKFQRISPRYHHNFCFKLSN